MFRIAAVAGMSLGSLLMQCTPKCAPTSPAPTTTTIPAAPAPTTTVAEIVNG